MKDKGVSIPIMSKVRKFDFVLLLDIELLTLNPIFSALKSQNLKISMHISNQSKFDRRSILSSDGTV